MKQEIKERVEKIHKGEVPEGYKETNVGILPDDWELEPLGNLFNFKNGVNAEAEKYGKGIKFVNIMEIINNNSLSSKLILGEVELSKKAIKENLVIKGDVLFNRTSETAEDIGLTSVYLDDAEVVFGGFVIRGRQKKKVLHDKFKKYCFRFSYLRNQIRVRGQGVVRSNIGQKDLEKVMLNIPRPDEQQIIAEILSTWDKAIELKEKLIEEKKEFKRGLMQKLLTGEMRFPEFTGEWEQKKLGDIFSERKETNQNGSELLSITSSRGVIKRSEIERKDNSNEDKSKYKKICCGDIGYNTMRMWQGVSAVSEYEGIVSPAYTVVKLKQDGDIYYFGYLFKLRKMINLLWRHSQGLVNDTLNLKYENFKNIKVTVPTSKVEQEKISSTLKSIDKEISLIKAEKELLKKQKRGLMQLLLTGIVRVEVD